MDIPPALLQFIGSLVAILTLAGLAWILRLGPEPVLIDEASARIAADEAVSGYDPVAIALDRDGRGALLRDANGRILLLRPHGTHLAGRILTQAASARLDGDRLTIDTAEKNYGMASLRLAEPAGWLKAIEAIRG